LIFFLAELPNGIAPPVHMFDWRYNQEVRNWILLPILLITLYWLYRYFKNLQKEIQKRKPRLPVHTADTLKEKIEIIQRNYSSNFQYRDGLHELSALMRFHFESKTGIEIEEMTAEEIKYRIKDKKVSNFFLNLSFLQFGKEEPMKSEFDELFTEAKIASGLENIPKPKERSKSKEIVRPKN
jgi:hypothetical protein